MNTKEDAAGIPSDLVGTFGTGKKVRERQSQLVLLTGSSGYIGGRLLSKLEDRGAFVRCLARKPQFIRNRLGKNTEVAKGDVLDKETLRDAFKGVDTAYYMVHSMGSKGPGDFSERDRLGAENFSQAARESGVRRIVYLGALGREDEELSSHLRSRHQVGHVLRSSGVEVIEFRASIVIGAGSLSFEMLRSLVDRLPVMVTPKWVHVKAQPIAIDDLLQYLGDALKLPVQGNRIYEIGGLDQVSYGDLMHEYARQRHLLRYMIPVPFLTPHLSSLWLGLVTPLYARVGRILIKSICHETFVRDKSALKDFKVKPMGVAQAISRALIAEDLDLSQTRWSDALSAGGANPEQLGTYGGVRLGRCLVDTRTTYLAVTPAVAFSPIRRIGGTTGWYACDWLLQLRGFLDLLVGGVGVRRGRPEGRSLSVGDTLDWWRVEEYQDDRLLRLVAEMKLPGKAWLEFEVQPTPQGSTIRQTAVFDPAGLTGLMYWYGIYPIHAAVFKAMLAGIKRAALRLDRPL